MCLNGLCMVYFDRKAMNIRGVKVYRELEYTCTYAVLTQVAEYFRSSCLKLNICMGPVRYYIWEHSTSAEL